MFSPPPLPTFSNPFADALGGSSTKIKLTSESGTNIDFKFNPTQFSLDRAVQWEDTRPMKEAYGILSFTGGSSDTLSFTTMLDTTEEEGKDILSSVKAIYGLTDATITEATYQRPPMVKFVWKDFLFTGVISSVKFDFTLYSPEGKPLRADVSITMLGRAFADQLDAKKFFFPFSKTP